MKSLPNPYRKIVVFEGTDTIDCYTVITPDGSVFGMSEDPTSSQGFNQYCGELEEFPQGLSHTGTFLKDIPDCVILGLKARGYSLAQLYDWVGGLSCK